MKRSDLTQLLVLAAIEKNGFDAWEVLTATFPPKVVLAAIMREVEAGNLTYGATARRPWLTDKGSAQ